MKFLQETDDVFEEYHVPSGPRLDFGASGAGAENTYQIPSQFDKFKKKDWKKCTFGGIQRFKGSAQALSARYSEPGPGQYDAKDGPPRPTSKYGMIGPLSHKDRREGLQPGQGMTPRPITSRLSLNSTLSSRAQLLDSLKDEFPGEKVASPPRTARSLPAGQARPEQAGGLSSRGSSRRPVTAPNDRLDFGPMGQGGMYHVFKFQTELDRAALKLNIPTSSMGTSHRAGQVRDYFPEPGPGAYSTIRQWGRPRHNYTSPMGTPRSRLEYGAGSLNEANSGFSGRIGSQFDKAAARRQVPSSSFGTSQRFGKGESFSDSLVPGPSSYRYDIDSVRKTQPTFSFASPRMRPPGYRKRTGPSGTSSRNTSQNLSHEPSVAKSVPAASQPKATSSRDASAAQDGSPSRDVVVTADENFASGKSESQPGKPESQRESDAASAGRAAGAASGAVKSPGGDVTTPAASRSKSTGDVGKGDGRSGEEEKRTDQAGEDAASSAEVQAHAARDDAKPADAKKEEDAGRSEQHEGLAGLDV